MKKSKNRRLIAAIIILIATVLIIVGYQAYRYPDMFRMLEDKSLNDSQTEALAESILSKDDKKILIAYFSYSGTTKEVAEAIGEQLDGDVFEISPKEEYGNVYLQSNNEIRFNSRPEIKGAVADMEKYDVVFIGYPVWWHATPAIINTFLESYDLSDKLIIPFCTSGGSDISNTMPTFLNSCENLAIFGARRVTSVSEIESWLMDLGFNTSENTADNAQISDNSALDDSTSSNTDASTAEENSENESDENSADNEKSKKNGKVLVAYFTWSGNTKEMAEYIAEQTSGDILEIEPLTPYPNDYNETGELAKVERDENQRPEIANLPESLDEYDTIILGYPIWWHTTPMIIGTFLESYDLTGIDIYPFTQSASMDTEQFENSMEFVRECAGNGTVHDGLFTEHTDTAGIDEYLRDNGITE